MKKYFFLFSFSLVAMINQLYAQCSQCTPVDCSVQKPAGGLCNQLPDDTTGQYYDEVISFYMPPNLSDPATLAQCGGCSSVDLRHITIVGIQGLPPGVSYTASQGGDYDVQGGDALGCVRFCGTPVAPGTYIIIVNLLADVTAHGTPIGDVSVDDQPQTYRDTVTFIPGTSACPGTFTLGNGPCVTKACDSVSVDLEATLDNPFCANLISYDWTYGNGNSGHVKSPGVVNYTTPDTFPLTLTTTYYTYRIKSVFVEAKGGWSGDIEEATTLQDPEPFIKINALGFDNKSTASSGKTKTFNNLNLVIPYNNCATPLEIEVWDLDESIAPTISPSDLLSTHSITPGVPNAVASLQGNSNISVTFDTVASSSVTESIDIIVHPHPPVPEVLFTKDSICGGDSTLMYVTPTGLSGYLYTWYLNDTTEITIPDSAFYVKQKGTYKVKITNAETGCSEMSTNSSFFVATSAPGSINVLFNGTSAFISPFPATGFAAEWYYNGNLVVGQTGKFLAYLGNGDYYAVLYNTEFPACNVTSAVKTITVSDVSYLADNSLSNLQIFPNPSNGQFTLKFNSEETQEVIVRIQNAVGQIVSEKVLENFAGDFNQQIDLTALSNGVYFVAVETQKGKLNSRIVVQ